MKDERNLGDTFIASDIKVSDITKEGLIEAV